MEAIPRIEAPTVAEHRAQRRRAIVAHAADLLLEAGPVAVTPASVAKAIGIARTSVYQYFPTSAELIAAAVEELLTAARAEIESAVAEAGTDASARLTAYVTTTLALSARGHGVVQAFDPSVLPEQGRARMRELHDTLSAPLGAILRDFGTEPSLASALVQGTLRGAGALAEQGVPVGIVAARAIAFIRGGLDSSG